MLGNVIISSMADQGGVNDYAADLVAGTRALDLESLTALNKSATNYYLQLFDLPFTADARTVGATTSANSSITLAKHGFQDGDQVATVGIPGLTNGTYYVRRAPSGTRPDLGADPNTFYLYDTLAHALDRTSLAGLQAVTDAVSTGSVQITGTADTTQSPAVTKSLVAEELPLLGTNSTPSNIVSYLNGRFNRGLYVRVVTAIGGSTKGGSDVKFTPRFRYLHGA